MKLYYVTKTIASSDGTYVPGQVIQLSDKVAASYVKAAAIRPEPLGQDEAKKVNSKDVPSVAKELKDPVPTTPGRNNADQAKK